MLNGVLAKRYAQALFELAVQMKVLDQIDAELQDFSALLKDNREMRTILNHPNIGLSDKKAIVAKICAAYSQVTLHFMFLLIENRRQDMLILIGKEFSRMADAARSVVEVKLTSAAALTEQQEKRITEVLAARTGGNIRLVQVVDADLLGGAKLQIGDTVMDGSVGAALRRLRNDLKKISL